MDEMMDVVRIWLTVQKSIDSAKKMGDGVMLSILCTAIDYVALKLEKESIELIDDLRPLVEECNKMFGGFKD